YVDLNEKLSIFTDDEVLSGPVDRLRQADYWVRAHNHIIAPQLGCEWSHGLTSWLALSCNAKGAWGVNLVDVTAELQRGDGLIGRRGVRSDTIFSHMYELNFYADLCVCANMRFRAGYNLMWLVNVDEAVGQINYNLADPRALSHNDNGSVLYHGPVFELQV